jgi:hypothetical protein
MTKPNLSADVAAFLARGGAITVCATGERSGVIERTIAAQKALERGYAIEGSRAFDYTVYSMNRAEGANHADAVQFAINHAAMGA